MPPITVPLRAPELAPGRWIQGPEVSIRAARGTVVLVDFWESTCVNCLRTLPYLRAWHERYAARGLAIVGVHTPEFDLSADPELVAAAVRDYAIPYAVLLDADRATWTRFANHYWPAEHLIDGRGYLRYEHAGGGPTARPRAGSSGCCGRPATRADAGDPGSPCATPTAPAPSATRRPARPTSASTAAGCWRPRGTVPGRRSRTARNRSRRRRGPSPPAGAGCTRPNTWRLREPGAGLEMLCDAAGVNLLLAPAGELEIEVDGAPVAAAERGEDIVEREGRTFAVWERARLVRLVASATFRRRRLVLRFPQAGVRAYAFSFETCAVG